MASSMPMGEFSSSETRANTAEMRSSSRTCGDGKDPNNRTQWENPSFDALIKAAGLETDPPKRFGLLRQAEQLFIDEMPSIPIYNYVKHDLVRPWVSGYTEHLQGIHLAKYFRIQP